jgi:hypothetical protein
VIADPRERGHALAVFYLATAPRLFVDLEESGALPDEAPAARDEWECFALYACVRGLVAAGGFNRESAAAIDAMHETVLAVWAAERPAEIEIRRARVAERYAEYGTIGQEHGASGAATVTARLGRAAALHLAGGGAGEPLAEIAGQLHEALAEGAAEAVRETP